MLFISYGLQKSASTFCCQLTRDIAEAAGHDQAALRALLPPELRQGFVNLKEYDLRKAAELIPCDRVLVFKTHSPMLRQVNDLLDEGLVMASATFRDPRDAAVAVYDVAAKDRAQGIDRIFGSIHSMREAIDLIAGNLWNANTWLSNPRVLPVPFDELAQRPEVSVRRLAAHMGVNADPNRILAPYRSGEQAIGEFNKGTSGRHRQAMSEADLAYAEEKFRGILDHAAPSLLAACATENPMNLQGGIPHA
jgi:hypothetical protein